MDRFRVVSLFDNEIKHIPVTCKGRPIERCQATIVFEVNIRAGVKQSFYTA